jgi:hypothetical protein
MTLQRLRNRCSVRRADAPSRRLRAARRASNEDVHTVPRDDGVFAQRANLMSDQDLNGGSRLDPLSAVASRSRRSGASSVGRVTAASRSQRSSATPSDAVGADTGARARNAHAVSTAQRTTPAESPAAAANPARSRRGSNVLTASPDSYTRSKRVLARLRSRVTRDRTATFAKVST